MKSKIITKAQVTGIAHSFGCEIRYSGVNRAFYLFGDRSNEAFSSILNNLGPGLHFDIVVDD